MAPATRMSVLELFKAMHQLISKEMFMNTYVLEVGTASEASSSRNLWDVAEARLRLPSKEPTASAITVTYDCRP